MCPVAPCLHALLVLSTSAVDSAAAAPQQSGGPSQERAELSRDELEALVLDLEQRVVELEASPVEPEPAKTPATLGEATHTTPEGFWAIPGSEFGFKVGGYVKLDVIHDFNEIGNRYKLQTNTIAVPGESDSVTTIHARESRLNFDLRGPVGGHDFRVFVEGDFFGDGNDFELRHAYGQLGGLLAGQTWTTYMDLSSRPHTLDFEGPDGELFIRQPMVRFTQPLSDGNTFSVALEDSSFDYTVVDETESVGDNPLPDLAANLRLEGEHRHVQFSGVLRYLELDGQGGAPDEDTVGWGVAVSGKTELGSDANRLMGQVAYGEGSARYNQATRGTGSDAVLDGSSLDALPVLTAVAGVEHDWSEAWSSTLAMSFARVDNSSLQAEDALHRSGSGSVNLTWHPYPRFLVGGEYLYGMRENRDGEDGDAHRIQFSFKFLF